jgi:PHD/YefM family antitoxin component YafN of YafNO toxin-antitoxin module
MSETVSDTRRRLTQHVQQFRDQGIEAAPVIFGDRRQPEAVLLPYETLNLLLDIAEDITIAQRIRERDAGDTGDRTTLAEAAAELDVNLDEL